MISRIALLVFFWCLFSGSNVFAEPTCYDCHSKDLFIGKVIHTPVAKGDCHDCHNPHVAKYGNTPNIERTPAKRPVFESKSFVPT